MKKITPPKKSKADLRINEARLELYTLLGEGYRDMKEGKENTLEEVKAEITKRRKKRE